MAVLACPYLGGAVELSEERGLHIPERHPDLLPYWYRIADVLRDPYEVRRSRRFSSAKLFSKWYTEEPTQKHVVIVIMTDTTIADRHWVITA